jgi:hydroxymethylpyrimidine/phosphomethylpyrimidine kinase
MVRVKKSPTNLGHYAQEVFRANELPYMASLRKKILSSLTTIIGNLFEAAIVLEQYEMKQL